MGLWQKVVSFIAPPPFDCGHDAELHKLRNEVLAARLGRAVAEQKAQSVFAELLLFRSQVRILENAIRAEHPAGYDYADAVSSLQLQRRLTSVALTDLAGTLEEATGRLAIVESELRAAYGGSQTALLEPDADDELPIPDEEIVSDKVLELAYRLVGVWFEGRHQWVLARGEERIKVPIHDRDWLDRMRRGEVSFIAGDTLLAEFRVVTYRRGSDVWADQSVERVIRIIHPDEQIELPQTSGEEVTHA